jgi:hypothetical protein
MAQQTKPLSAYGTGERRFWIITEADRSRQLTVSAIECWVLVNAINSHRRLPYRLLRSR